MLLMSICDAILIKYFLLRGWKLIHNFLMQLSVNNSKRELACRHKCRFLVNLFLVKAGNNRSLSKEMQNSKACHSINIVTTLSQSSTYFVNRVARLNPLVMSISTQFNK